MADQCTAPGDRPIMCFAAVYGTAFQIVEFEDKPFVYLEGLRPPDWSDPDASLYRLSVFPNRIRFDLAKICERLNLLPFPTDSPEKFWLFRRSDQYPALIAAINALYHEHDPRNQNRPSFETPGADYDGRG